MKWLSFVLLASFPVLGYSSDPLDKLPMVEEEIDLGHGFRRVTLAERVDVGFESIGHFEYLFYRRQKIADVTHCSVSPDGCYAIYHKGSSGHLHLFRRLDRQHTQLTTQFIGLPKSFEWSQDMKAVQVTFDKGLKKSFQLN